MPSRPLDSTDLISLPRLDALQALAFSQALDTAAKDDNGVQLNLPDTVAEALEDVRADRAALQSAVGVAAPEPEVRKADRREDRAVRAIFRLVEAWEELEGEIPQGALGAKIRQRLFGKDKLSFLTLQPRAEWAVVETKLGVIQSEGLEAELDQLGAMPMLQHLRQVHALYGEVTGATRAAAPTSPQVRERLDALLDSIKHYVAAVVGSVKRKDPATKALADRVLKPLADWESKAPSGGGGSSPDEGAPGAGGG